MENSPTPPSDIPQESPRRLLDPFAEWRDHANRWDVSELLKKKPEENAPARADQEPLG